MQQIQRIVGLTRVEQKNSNEEQLSSNQITSNFKTKVLNNTSYSKEGPIKTQLHQLDQAQHLNMCRHMPPHATTLHVPGHYTPIPVYAPAGSARRLVTGAGRLPPDGHPLAGVGPQASLMQRQPI